MSETSIRVRVGTPADFHTMLPFCQEMHDENGVARLNPAKMIGTLQCLLAKYYGIVGIIDGDNGEVAASVGLAVSEWWYSDDQHLEDRWTFVSAPYRRRWGSAARLLIDWAKLAADEMNMPLIMGVMSSHRTVAKIKLFERQLPLAGAVFVHNNPFFAEKQEA